MEENVLIDNLLLAERSEMEFQVDDREDREQILQIFLKLSYSLQFFIVVADGSIDRLFCKLIDSLLEMNRTEAV